jgi:hypothetical protein
MKPGCTYFGSVFLGALILMAGCNNRPVTPIPSNGTVPGVYNTSTVNPDVDKSPLDFSYYPVDYPQLKMTGRTSQPLVARVIYSRPSVGGRKIFGDLLQFGKPWRLGANEATEIEFFQPVIIQNKKIESGRYVLYAKPYPDHWTIIFNSELYTWGLKIDSTKDIFKVDVPVTKLSRSIPVFTMQFSDAADGSALLMGWDSVHTSLPFTVSK